MEVENAEENLIYGSPEVIGRCKIIFSGKNNKIIFNEKVKCKNCIFKFKGSNSIIEIGSDSMVAGEFIVLESCSIHVGENTKFNRACRLHAAERKKIVIGQGCLFANVNFRTSDSHSIIDLSTGVRLNIAKDISVGDNVWIAENVFIYKGGSIGAGSVIGAHSVVTNKIPSNCLAVGVPARCVKKEISWRERLI